MSHGLTDIHCIVGPDGFGPSGRRKSGWEQAMAAQGISTLGKVHRTSYDRLKAETVVRSILSAESPPQAIFATTDEQALATLRAAAVVGLHIPRDLALVGFDGIREALYGSTRLTTISLPLTELASRAFDVLAAWDDPAEKKNHVLSGTLVTGETCGGP